MIRYILVALILSGMAGPGFTSAPASLPSRVDSVSGLHQQILFSILDLQFSKADSLLNLVAEQDPGEPETPYLENYLEFLDAIISGDIVSYQNYQEASDKRIESIRDGRKDHPAGSY